MAKVYKRANRVLVLDADLLATAVPPIARLDEIRPDMHARILTSNWQRRAWTLQEAVLAKRLWFRFANETCEKRSLPDPLLDRFFDDPVTYVADTQDFDWNRPELQQLTSVERVTRVWSLLFGCGITDPDDLPLCIAILLDLQPLARLTRGPPAARHRTLWSMLTVVPAGVLMHPVPRRREPEVRWALADMADVGNLPSPVLHPAFVQPDGEVRVQLHGFTIPLPSDVPRPHTVLPFQIGDEVFYARQNLNRGSPPWPDVLSWATARELGLLLGQAPPTPSYDGEDLEPRRPKLAAALAAMVAVVERKDGAIVVEYLTAVSVVKRGTTFDETPRVP